MIMGDGNGDGAVTNDDSALIDAVLTKQSDLSGAKLRALQLSLSYGLPAPECRALIRTPLPHTLRAPAA